MELGTEGMYTNGSGRLEMEVDEARKRVRLVVRGEIDMVNADDFATLLANLQDRNESVEVDLGGLSFIDSSGIHVLLKASVAYPGKGRILLARTQPTFERLLEVLGVGDRFERVG